MLVFSSVCADVSASFLLKFSECAEEILQNVSEKSGATLVRLRVDEEPCYKLVGTWATVKGAHDYLSYFEEMASQQPSKAPTPVQMYRNLSGTGRREPVDVSGGTEGGRPGAGSQLPRLNGADSVVGVPGDKLEPPGSDPPQGKTGTCRKDPPPPRDDVSVKAERPSSERNPEPAACNKDPQRASPKMPLENKNHWNGQEELQQIFACGDCCYTSHSKRGLNEHQKRKHIKPLRCNFCSKTFGLTKDINRHVRKIHMSIRYCCTFCGKVYMDHERFEKHQTVHRSLRNFDYPPKDKQNAIDSDRKVNCGIVNADRKVGVTLKVKFPPKGKGQSVKELSGFTCLDCSYVAKTRRCLIDHRKRRHMKTLKCDVCGSMFGLLKDLRRHQKQSHNLPCQELSFDDNSFLAVFDNNIMCSGLQAGYHNCSVPSMENPENNAYINKHVLQKDDMYQKGLPQFPEKYSTLKSDSTLSPSVVEAVSKRVCWVCEKVFESKKRLSKHIGVHEKSRQRKKMRCYVCSKTFFSSFAFFSHQVAHVQKVMFKCKFCNLSSSLLAVIKRHMLKIHGQTFSLRPAMYYKQSAINNI